MSLGTVERLSRTVRVAYSRHPAARLYRIWRRWTGTGAGEDQVCAADILLLPLAGLALSLFVLSVPGAGEAIADACSTACMP